MRGSGATAARLGIVPQARGQRSSARDATMDRCAMNREPDFFQNLQDELSDGRAWLDRSIVLGYRVLAGLFVVALTYMSEHAFEWFKHLHASSPWVVLIWTPRSLATTCRTCRCSGASGLPWRWPTPPPMPRPWPTT